MPEANAEMLTQLSPPAEKDETAEKHSILEVYVLTAMDNEKDDSTEKDGDAEVDNNSEMNEEEINSESNDEDDDDDITEVDTITTMIKSTVMNSEVEANSEPEFEEKVANTENDEDATAKMDCNADTDNTKQRPKIPSYASFTIDGTLKINGTTVMKDFVPVEGIPNADENETAETRGPNGPMAMICLKDSCKGKGLGKGKKGTKTKRPAETETQDEAAEIDTEMPISEEEMMNVLPKLRKKSKKAQKEMCPVCKNQGFIKYQTTLKLGGAKKAYNMQMFLVDTVNGEESVPAIPTKYLN